jgi:hypothetical protein
MVSSFLSPFLDFSHAAVNLPLLFPPKSRGVCHRKSKKKRKRGAGVQVCRRRRGRWLERWRCLRRSV